MSTTPPPEYEVERGTGGSTPRWVGIVLILIAVVLVYVAYGQWAARARVSQMEKAANQVARLEARTATLEDNYANVKGQLDATSDRVGLTQKDLQRARAVARQIKEEQQKAVAALDTELDTLRAEQENRFGTLSGEVTTVKGDVETTRQVLTDAQSKLDRAIGDLGVQSGLIARNAEELGELKRRGDRDYFEFDLRKSKDYNRVGTISIRVNKTDPKRQKYTITLLANDKRIEKKDKTLLEPVQFYLQGTRHLMEIVVYDVQKDRLIGYVSAPKELAARTSGSGN